MILYAEVLQSPAAQVLYNSLFKIQFQVQRKAYSPLPKTLTLVLKP